MRHRSPLVTLGAVALYFVAMLAANMIVHPAGSRTSAPPLSPFTASTAQPSDPSSSRPRGGWVAGSVEGSSELATPELASGDTDVTGALHDCSTD